MIDIRLSEEELGYVLMAVRMSHKKQLKGADKFDAVRPDSSLAHRLRVGAKVLSLLQVRGLREDEPFDARLAGGADGNR